MNPSPATENSTCLRLLGSALALAFAASPLRAQTYVGNLDGSHVNSTFTTAVDGDNAIGGFGWADVTSTARVFGQTGAGKNDVLIASAANGGFANYKVEYNTGATLVASSTYTLTFSMGFVSTAAGTSSYLFALGTWDGATFTTLQSTSGTVDRSAGPTFGASMGNDVNAVETVSLNYTTAAGGLPTDPIYVRWERTAGTGLADYFGFDNVTLSHVAAVPEPSAYAAILGVGALGLAAWRRRRVA